MRALALSDGARVCAVGAASRLAASRLRGDGAATSFARAELVAEALAASGLCGKGGVSATATAETGQQWDSPNAWPPLQLLIVESLLDFPLDARERGEQAGSEKVRTLGASLASAWLRSAHDGWKETGFMHEKYDYRGGGVAGRGGEYDPQVGFGWTNGAALALMDRGLFPAPSSGRGGGGAV